MSQKLEVGTNTENRFGVLEVSSQERRAKWQLQQNESRTRRSPSFPRASTTAARSAEGRAPTCASSASAACVSVGSRCGVRFPGFRSRRGRNWPSCWSLVLGQRWAIFADERVVRYAEDKRRTTKDQKEAAAGSPGHRERTSSLRRSKR